MTKTCFNCNRIDSCLEFTSAVDCDYWIPDTRAKLILLRDENADLRKRIEQLEIIVNVVKRVPQVKRLVVELCPFADLDFILKELEYVESDDM